MLQDDRDMVNKKIGGATPSAKPFRYDEDGDLVCTRCGRQVRQMRLYARFAIGIEWYEGTEFECVDWEQDEDPILHCECGLIHSPGTFEWEDIDCGVWVLRVNPDTIANKPPEE